MPITSAQQQQLLQLGVTTFNASLGGYMSELATAINAGSTVAQIYDAVANSTAFKSQSFAYGAASTNAQFATAFANNTLGSTVSATIITAAATYLQGLLDAGASRGSVMMTAADYLSSAGALADTTYGAAAQQFVNKVTVATDYTITQNGLSTTVAALQATVASVTNAAATVTAALSANALSSQSFALTTGTDTLIGSASDNVINAPAGTLTVGDTIDGGAGTDTLNVSTTGTVPAVTIKNIEVLTVLATPNPVTWDLSGVTGLTTINSVNNAAGAGLTVSNVANVVNASMQNTNSGLSITYATAAVSGTSDASTLTLSKVGAGATFTGSGVETLTINSKDGANVLASLTDTGLTKLVITGDQALTIGTDNGTGATPTATIGSTTIGTVDASAATGAISISTGNGVGGATGNTTKVGVTVTAPTASTGTLALTTGTQKDTVTLGAGNATVVLGAGDDTLTSGTGTNTITPGTGNDTITLSTGTDTIRFNEAGATNADTVTGFATKSVIALGLGSAQTTTAAAAAGQFGTVQTNGTSPVLSGVGGTGTATAISFASITPNATATTNTVSAASNVLALSGAFTDGTAAGVITALGTTATTGITTTATGKFVLVTYSVGNIAQVWSYAGDSATAGVATDIDAAELNLVATLNGVTANSLAAANFTTYLTPAAGTTTVSNTGQTITLSGTLNTVQNTPNAAGQFLTAANDTINVNVGTMPTAAATATSGLTIIDPSSTDADVLNASVLGDWAAGSVISGIETLNLNMLVAGTTFSAAGKAPGTTNFALTGAQPFTVTDLANGSAITLGSGYTGLASGKMISDVGTADTLTVNIAGSTATSATAGAAMIYVNNGGAIETATVNVSAASSVRMAGTGLLGTVADVTAINLAGSGSLTVFGAFGALDTMVLNGSGIGYTGNLTIRPTTSGNMDFSAGGVVTGIKTIDLQDIPTYAGTIVFSGSNTSNSVLSATVSNVPTATSQTQGAIVVSVLGGGSQTDAVTFSEGANVSTIGNITATTIETLTVASSRASTGTFAMGTVTLTDGPGTQKLVVTGASTITVGVITADTIDFSGTTGAVTITGAAVNTGTGVSFTGGSGGISWNVAGTAGALQDSLVFGSGADRVGMSDGDDVVTLGAGADIVSYVANANAAAVGVTVGPTITDFAAGTDKLLFDKSVMGLGGAASGLTATETAIATTDYFEGASTSMTAGTAYTVVALNAVAYSGVGTAEDAVSATSTSATTAIVIFLDSTLGYARAYYDASLVADGGLTDTAVIANFTNITTLAGITALSNTDFLMIA